MNDNINEKKCRWKICCVLLVVALLGIGTMIPSVFSTNFNTNENKNIIDITFSMKNLRSNLILTHLLQYRMKTVSQEYLRPTGL